MKPIVGVLFLTFLLVTGGNYISASWENGTISGTLTVEVSIYPTGTEGLVLYVALFPRGPIIGICADVASGELLIGTEASTVMGDPQTEDEIFLNLGAYSLYLWIDMNDTLDTVH